MPKVVALKNMPFKLPLWQTVTIYLLLDRLHVNPVVWGIVGTLVVISWIVSIALIIKQEQIDLFKEDK